MQWYFCSFGCIFRRSYCPISIQGHHRKIHAHKSVFLHWIHWSRSISSWNWSRNPDFPPDSLLQRINWQPKWRFEKGHRKWTDRIHRKMQSFPHRFRCYWMRTPQKLRHDKLGHIQRRRINHCNRSWPHWRIQLEQTVPLQRKTLEKAKERYRSCSSISNEQTLKRQNQSQTRSSLLKHKVNLLQWVLRVIEHRNKRTW